MIFMGINYSDDFLIGKWRNASFAPYIIYFFIYLLFWLTWYKFYAIVTSTFPPSVDLQFDGQSAFHSGSRTYFHKHRFVKRYVFGAALNLF